MKTPRLALIRLLTTGLALMGCQAPERSLPLLNSSEKTLATVSEPDGSVIYGLLSSRETVRLTVSHLRPVSRAYVGFQVADLSDDSALSRGIVPFSGPIVTSVQPGSPAARAGLLAGDIISSVAESRGGSARKVRQVIARWRPADAPLALGIKRGRGETVREIEIPITPDPRPDVEELREERPLADVAAYPTTLGLVLATVPEDLSREIYGLTEPQILVAGVYLGSPAWRVGLRAGDRVISVDSQSYRSARTLGADLLAWRIEGRKSSVSLEVAGPAGPWSARLDLEDEAARHRFFVPPLVDVETSRQRTEWNLLLVLLNYRSRPEPSPGRSSRKSSKLAVLFDALAIERGPRGTHFTILWFIHL